MTNRRRAKLGKLLRGLPLKSIYSNGHWCFVYKSTLKRMIRRAQALKGFYR